ncbi:transglutaminase family protein [Hymenobacter psoromatis]|uniref:transglutaminase family protein n=1 Tax=Hymenobacter psoromatis TaxID=1484116 RepID=UPI001CBF4E15|nr:transglutaminase family protein [Hymenobacter psoromatis]
MSSYKIQHRTRYVYAAPVIDCANQLMIYPLPDERLTVKSHVVRISQHPEVALFTDYFGNQVGVFSLIQPHDELVIESLAEVETHAIQFPMDEETAETQWAALAALCTDAAFMDFLRPSPSGLEAELRQALGGIVTAGAKPLKQALELSEYVHDNFQYQQGVTSIETPLEDIWRLRAGVCQDFAHLLLHLLRLNGLPARYVSGYVCPREEGVRGAGATHAWVEVYLPFYGWLGLDPTNNCIVNDGHVRMAIGRHFADCTPVKGTYKGTGAHTLEVTVHIENGHPIAGNDAPETPIYVRQAPTPIAPAAVNSYRKYLDWEQQQQQQQ